MKGRRRIHDHPIQKNFTIELWMGELIEECKKYGIRPVDVVKAGLLHIFRPENTLPQSLIKSYIERVEPQTKEWTENLEYFKSLYTELSENPLEQGKTLAKIKPRKKMWFDDFRAVRYADKPDAILVDLKTCDSHADLLVPVDDDEENPPDWNTLPRFHSFNAIRKYFETAPQENPQQQEVKAA